MANSYLHNDSFPAKHPLWVGPLGYQGSKAAMTLIAKADVVLALGTRLGPFGTLPQYGIEYWPKDAKIIQVDADAKMLGLVKSISVGICGDARAAAQALVERLSGKALACIANKDARLAEIAATKKAWETELDGWAHEKDAWSLEVSKNSTYMHPRQMLRELEKAMPEGAMVSTDIGNICSVSNSYLRFNRPRSMLAAMSFGNCGYAFPTVVGAKVAAPGSAGDRLRRRRRVGHELRRDPDVRAREHSGHRRRLQQRPVGRGEEEPRRLLREPLRRREPRQAAVVGRRSRKAMGAEGQTIEKLADVGPALRAAAKAQGEGKTTILEMMVTRELGDPFRRDALALPTRHLAKYQSTAAAASLTRGCPGNDVIQLYYYPGNASLAVHILLEELGVPFELAARRPRQRRAQVARVPEAQPERADTGAGRRRSRALRDGGDLPASRRHAPGGESRAAASPRPTVRISTSGSCGAATRCRRC